MRFRGNRLAPVPALQQTLHREAVVHRLTAPAGLRGFMVDVDTCSAVVSTITCHCGGILYSIGASNSKWRITPTEVCYGPS